MPQLLADSSMPVLVPVIPSSEDFNEEERKDAALGLADEEDAKDVVQDLVLSMLAVEKCLNNKPPTKEFDRLNEWYLKNMKVYRREFRELRGIIVSEFKLFLLPTIKQDAKRRLNELEANLKYIKGVSDRSIANFDRVLAEKSTLKRQACVDFLLKQPAFSCYGSCNLQVKIHIAKKEFALMVNPLEEPKPLASDYHCMACHDLLSSPVVLTCAHRVCWNC